MHSIATNNCKGKNIRTASTLALFSATCLSVNAINFIGFTSGSVSQSALGPASAHMVLFNQWDPAHCGTALAEGVETAAGGIQLLKVQETGSEFFHLHTTLSVSGTIHSSPGIGSPNPTIDNVSASLLIGYETSTEAYFLLDSVAMVEQKLIGATHAGSEYFYATQTDPAYAATSGDAFRSDPSFHPFPELFSQIIHIGFASSLIHNSIDLGELETGFTINHLGEVDLVGSSDGSISIAPTTDGYSFTAVLQTLFTREVSLSLEQFTFSTQMYGLLRTDLTECPDNGSNLQLLLIGSSLFAVVKLGARRRSRASR